MADPRPRKLVLLRHGRTEWNHARRAQGHADVPLDSVGEAQARAAAPLVAALRPARVWSSDLLRARQTADLLAEACGLTVETDPRLREFSVGERQGLTWGEAIERFPWIVQGVGLGERLAGVPGAETDADVRARVVPAVEEHLEELAPGQTGVLVGHGAATKLALAGLLGWDDAVVRTLSVLDNCHWSTVLAPAGGGTRRLLDYGVGDFASLAAIG
ncbi:MAG TPA: histidine phosphatase family protein [Marmoricola sp.]|nr:histidine phosphatase family protein [Marmoricola sp.]